MVNIEKDFGREDTAKNKQLGTCKQLIKKLAQNLGRLG